MSEGAGRTTPEPEVGQKIFFSSGIRRRPGKYFKKSEMPQEIIDATPKRPRKFFNLQRRTPKAPVKEKCSRITDFYKVVKSDESPKGRPGMSAKRRLVYPDENSVEVDIVSYNFEDKTVDIPKLEKKIKSELEGIDFDEEIELPAAEIK